MNSLKRERIGKYIEVLTDYHSNGSYESLKKNVTLLTEKNYAVMIRTLNFERGDFDDDLIYVDKAAYEHLSKSKVYSNDILTNKIANPGSIYIMPDIKCPVTCGMNLFLIRFSQEVNQRYMYYCMKNSESYIKSFAHGTTTKTITKDEVRDLVLLIHTDIEDQNRVEKLFATLDKKIELNKKINVLLEEMAYTTYMHMFARKTANGKLGEIIEENPKSTIQVGDAKNNNGSIPFFTSGDTVLTWNESLVDGRNCFLNTGGNAGIKYYVGKAAYSTDTWCITGMNFLSDYLYMLLVSLKPELSRKFFQGTGLKHLQKPLLKDRPIYIPNSQEVETFHSAVNPYLTMISENIRESQQLITLRDWLMPILMNGQATITD